MIRFRPGISILGAFLVAIFLFTGTKIALFPTTSVAAGQKATTEQWWDACAKSQAPTWMQKLRISTDEKRQLQRRPR